MKKSLQTIPSNNNLALQKKITAWFPHWFFSHAWTRLTVVMIGLREWFENEKEECHLAGPAPTLHRSLTEGGNAEQIFLLQASFFFFFVVEIKLYIFFTLYFTNFCSLIHTDAMCF